MNQAMNFSTAPTTQMGDFELIPEGTLAFAILHVKKFGPEITSEDFVTPSKQLDDNGNPKSAYLNCELTICEGPFIRRKVFTRIGIRGSEEYVNQGRAAIRAILEVGRGANPTTNPQGYQLASYADLCGMKVAVKIKQEKGTVNPQTGVQIYKDKNEIARWLTPNKESDGYKSWEQLLAGSQAGGSSAVPSVGSVGSTASTQPTTQVSKPAMPTTGVAASGKPSWLG